MKLPVGSGLDVLQAAKDADAETPVVVMTAFGTVEEAVRAMKQGASDFLTKPVDTDHLLLLLDRAVESRRVATELVLLREDYQRRYGLPRVLGEDPVLKQAMLALQRAAGTDATVLLLGESGTGKELMSRALHQLSSRAKGPFVAINCAAIPDNLLESELFGHEKGAFTGATGRKIGKAELAHGGTLFLDEIGDMPLPLQGKILRLVQEKQFERVGGLQTLSVDVRVVAATNRDLRALVEQKLFREDLFFRLSVMRDRDPAAAAAAPGRAAPRRRLPAAARARDGPKGAAACRRRRSGRSPRTRGPATCASFRTASSAPRSCATAPRSSPRTCGSTRARAPGRGSPTCWTSRDRSPTCASARRSVPKRRRSHSRCSRPTGTVRRLPRSSG